MADRGVAPLVAWPGNGLTDIPFEIYSSPVQYEAELERIFKGPVWSFLGLACEVPAPGDYLTTGIGESSVVCVRGADGTLRSFVNRCAHRGALLCLDARGRLERGRFSCIYHGWTYDMDGRLASVAFSRGLNGEGGMADDFHPEGHGLRRLLTAEIAGLVFASFDPGAPPLEEYLGERIVAHLRRVLGRPVCVLGRNTQVLPSNWKLYVENVKDSYHASILHAFFTTFRLNRLTQSGEIVVDESGGNHVSYSRTDPSASNADYARLRSSVQGYRLQDPGILDAVDEFGDGIGIQILSVFPGFVLQQVRNSIAVRQILPRGVERTELHWTYLGFEDDDDEMLRRRLRQANLVGPAGYVSMEDGAVGGFVQRAVRGVGEDCGVVMMGGHDARSSPSRVTEASVRGFWKKYRSLVG